MSKIYFKVEGSVVIKYTPIPGIDNAYKNEVVMTKDIFRECYKKWINQEPETGHWVEETISMGSRKVFCSECGCSAPFEYVSNGDVYSASGSYGVINKTKFCPDCGKRMVEPQESEG